MGECGSKTIVENCHVLLAAVPELHHVGLRRLAHGDKALRPFRKERQDVRQVEHARARILPRYVEVRKVVHRRRRGQRIPRAYAAVRGADDEPVEVAPVSPYPERQDEEMPKHREHGGSWMV